MIKIKCPYCSSEDIIQGYKFNDCACEDCGVEFDEIFNKRIYI